MNGPIFELYPWWANSVATFGPISLLAHFWSSFPRAKSQFLFRDAGSVKCWLCESRPQALNRFSSPKLLPGVVGQSFGWLGLNCRHLWRAGAPLTVRPCQVRSSVEEQEAAVARGSAERVAWRGNLELKPTVQRLHHTGQPVPAVELARPPNCGTAAREGGGVWPGWAGPWLVVAVVGAMVLDARSPVSLPLERLPSAARFRLLRPLHPARAHCQFTDDKPFRVNSRRTARQPRCCFRATELWRRSS